MTDSRRPRPPILAWGGWSIVVVLAWFASGASSGPAPPKGALSRTFELLVAFMHPDLSADALMQAATLCIETVAVATWGTALGAGAGMALALAASERITLADGRPHSWRTRTTLGLSRGILDVLRAIPDFAWALLVLVVLGPGPVTGALALALGVTGLLGRVYSQLLDEVESERTRAVELTGGSRLVVALWGYVPTAAGPMLSYTLLRLECSMRNASVIGIVGGGGLGAALFEELGFGRYDRVATLLLMLLALTAVTDRISKGVARSLRRPGGLTRRRFALWIVGTLTLCAVVLGPAASIAVAELGRLDTDFLVATMRGLTSLEPSLEFVQALLADALVPLGIAVVATALAALAAAATLILVPRTTMGGHAPPLIRGIRVALRFGIDLLALVTRAIPDVVWLLVFGISLHMGPLAAIAAIATHSFGLLARLFAEAVDDVPRAAREACMVGSTRVMFVWGIWPRIAGVIWTHVFLQTESNLRAGLIVGIVGAGGLGDAFHDSITFWRLGDASMQALMMIALTVVVDRAARRLGARRVRAR